MKTQSQQPFFVRFLESQDYPQVQTEVKAGRPPPMVTMKFPSDDDEEGVTI